MDGYDRKSAFDLDANKMYSNGASCDSASKHPGGAAASHTQAKAKSARGAHLNSRARKETHGIEHEDHGVFLGFSWIAHLFQNCHPCYVIGVAALIVVFAGCRWVSHVPALVAIVTMTYAFATFVITLGCFHCDGVDSGFDGHHESGLEEPQETGELE
jgi:hypothetical protein